MTPATQLLLVLFALLPSTQAQTLLPRLDGDTISVQLPNFNLLSGKPLQRLKNGQSVAYDFHLQWLDNTPGNTAKIVARSAERFIISYDLWEENYSIVQLTSSNPKTPAARVARLKSEAVSTWCLGRLRLPVFAMSQADKSRPTRLQIEIRSAAPKLPNPIRGEGSLDLGTLIDIFSRPAGDGELRFTATSAPFTLISFATP